MARTVVAKARPVIGASPIDMAIQGAPGRWIGGGDWSNSPRVGVLAGSGTINSSPTGQPSDNGPISYTPVFIAVFVMALSSVIGRYFAPITLLRVIKHLFLLENVAAGVIDVIDVTGTFRSSSGSLYSTGAHHAFR